MTMTGAVTALLLAGCASSEEPGAQDTGMDDTATADPAESAAPAEIPNVAETMFPGAPDGVEGDGTTVHAGDDPRQLLVVTFGSSTCPVLPTDVMWDATAEVLQIELTDNEAYADRACTMDMAPTTSVVALPDEAPDAAGLTVEVDGSSLTVE
ncbi:hypothetical protein [Cellulomonas sp. S1-8]|uniref:hypothetical protein n=1 Tax=Cellulomonas sp. S1-8 TaxID=2904790 RepID=UPI002242C988|nr:hypothetical protein [Cellulomonas sp. S1-8]UZN03913.1 hypothetical protein OKX07_02940 [Cellulomonas sp. S1-8]